MRLREPMVCLRAVTAATFDVLITLSEEPKKDGFKKDHIDVTHATAGDPSLLDKMDETTDMVATGRDDMLYRYLVTLTPKYENKNDIVLKVKSFYDQEKMTPQMYMPPTQEVSYVEGKDKLTVKVGKEVLKDKTAGIVVGIAENTIIPKDGYLVVAKDLAGSAVLDPEPGDDSDNHLNSPAKTARQPYGLTYNRLAGGLPELGDVPDQWWDD